MIAMFDKDSITYTSESGTGYYTERKYSHIFEEVLTFNGYSVENRVAATMLMPKEFT